jgi:hypothetical protein
VTEHNHATSGAQAGRLLQRPQQGQAGGEHRAVAEERPQPHEQVGADPKTAPPLSSADN